MKLESIKYSQYDGELREWNLDNLSFDSVNLIVGKNATGKTRTFTLIHNLALLLRGERKPDFTSANFEANFIHKEKNYKYILRVSNAAVVKEKFEINDKVLLDRSENGTGTIFAKKLRKNMDFQTPVSELAFTSRQDNIQHPYFEPLYQWAQSVYCYAFGSPLGKDNLIVIQKEEAFNPNPKDTQMVIGIYKKGEADYKDIFKETIKRDLKNIGYDISDIGVDSPQNIKILGLIPQSGLLGLWVQEKDLKSRTEQSEISQGMFRVLSLIIQINYSKMAHQPSCILIDDIGEGLDFERSCLLIELLISKAKESNIQLIMTTNDRFVMNKVPLEMWTVLHREGAHCKVFNAKNAKDKFEDFRFTGLNNFDFFATDYLITESKK